MPKLKNGFAGSLIEAGVALPNFEPPAVPNPAKPLKPPPEPPIVALIRLENVGAEIFGCSCSFSVGVLLVLVVVGVTDGCLFNIENMFGTGESDAGFENKDADGGSMIKKLIFTLFRLIFNLK